MTDKDQAMLKSALWHISNSVTNGKSQTAECELTQWLKNKINPPSPEQPSEDLEEAASRYAKEEYSHKSPATLPDRCRGCYAPLMYAFKNGANWQKEHDTIFSQQQRTQISNACELIQSAININILNSNEHK